MSSESLNNNHVSSSNGVDTDDFDPIKEIRKHWCETLEENLECPVCLDVPAGKIYQCIEGHDVCYSCKKFLDTCPVCKGAFSYARNFSLEKLSSLFAEMKMSLMSPECEEKKTNVETKSISTQTTEDSGAVWIRKSSRISNKQQLSR